VLRNGLPHGTQRFSSDNLAIYHSLQAHSEWHDSVTVPANAKQGDEDAATSTAKASTDLLLWSEMNSRKGYCWRGP
jgi:hypothetical protein